MLIHLIERSKPKWLDDPKSSAAYQFFNVEDAVIKYDAKGRPYQWFPCAAERCKESGGVRRFQDTQDAGATSTLRNHANKCFGKDVVDAAYAGKPPPREHKSVFRLFARKGQEPVVASHRNYSAPEQRYVVSPFSVEFLLLIGQCWTVLDSLSGLLRQTDLCILSRIGASRISWKPVVLALPFLVSFALYP